MKTVKKIAAIIGISLIFSQNPVHAANQGPENNGWLSWKFIAGGATAALGIGTYLYNKEYKSRKNDEMLMTENRKPVSYNKLSSSLALETLKYAGLTILTICPAIIYSLPDRDVHPLHKLTYAGLAAATGIFLTKDTTSKINANIVQFKQQNPKIVRNGLLQETLTMIQGQKNIKGNQQSIDWQEIELRNKVIAENKVLMLQKLNLLGTMGITLPRDTRDEIYKILDGKADAYTGIKSKSNGQRLGAAAKINR